MPDGTEMVTDMEVARVLNAGEYSSLGCHVPLDYRSKIDERRPSFFPMEHAFCNFSSGAAMESENL